MASTPLNSGELKDAPTKYGVRKKTAAACEFCRTKRIKCNGSRPCDNCSKKRLDCIFVSAPTTANEGLAEKLDLVLSRMDRLEKSLRGLQNAQSSPRMQSRSLSESAVLRTYPSASADGRAQFNPETGCLEYYGGTSVFVIASSLGKRMKQLENAVDGQPSPKRYVNSSRSQTAAPQHSSTVYLEMDDLTGFCDYVVPPHAKYQHLRLRESVADRHLENFFETIHIFLPIFNRDSFTARYHSLRPLFGDHRLFLPSPREPTRPQFLCLIYAVLALGALYQDKRDDSSSWASWYFAEAQRSMGTLLDSANMDLVQAAMLMGAYAQHAMKPNLAYILNGIATRLAFSVGLNTATMHTSSRSWAEEGRRTWWCIYVQEVELSLDSGRPGSIRSVDTAMEYPTPVFGETRPAGCELQVEFVRYLAEIAKITKRILKFVNRVPTPGESVIVPEVPKLHEDLEAWCASLPPHLRFHDLTPGNSVFYLSVRSWQARQQSSLRIHYNLALITLLRGFLDKGRTYAEEQSQDYLASVHRNTCLVAARDMLDHIHHIFTLAPSLRRWSYYCFYCLQATLALLTNIVADMDVPPTNRDSMYLYSGPGWGEPGERLVDTIYCEKSIQIFEQIELKASQRCAEMVRQFLGKWASWNRRRHPLQEAASCSDSALNSKAEGNGRVEADQTITSSTLDSTSRTQPHMSLGVDLGQWHRGESSSATGTDPKDLALAAGVYHPSAQLYTSGSTMLQAKAGHSDFGTASNHDTIIGVDTVHDGNDPAPTSPQLSLGWLQTELYNAIHVGDQNRYDDCLGEPSMPSSDVGGTDFFGWMTQEM